MGVIDKLKEISIDLARRYNISYILLFGSYARGDYKGYSDIDIAVKFPSGWSDEEYIMKAGELALDLSEELDVRVDVVPVNIADSILKYEIYSSGQLVYSSNMDEYYDDMVNAIDEYLDFKEHFEKHYKRILSDIMREEDG